jgi:hypothetical protein
MTTAAIVERLTCQYSLVIWSLDCLSWFHTTMSSWASGGESLIVSSGPRLICSSSPSPWVSTSSSLMYLRANSGSDVAEIC